MTARSAYLLLTVTLPSLAGAGEVQGRLTFSGAAPVAASQPTTKDRAACGDAQPDESLLVKEGGLASAVVRIEVPGARAEPRRLTLDQQRCRFVPHVQAAPVGSTLDILNGDPILHSVHGWAGMGTAFNVPMPGAGQKTPRTLQKPGLIRIGCDVHAWMSAYVLVAETPYLAVTDPAGRFAIAGVPSGTWRAVVWHERFGEKAATVTVPAQGAAKLDLAFP
jgi:plastocyanin